MRLHGRRPSHPRSSFVLASPAVIRLPFLASSATCLLPLGRQDHQSFRRITSEGSKLLSPPRRYARHSMSTFASRVTPKLGSSAGEWFLWRGTAPLRYWTVVLCNRRLTTMRLSRGQPIDCYRIFSNSYSTSYELNLVQNVSSQTFPLYPSPASRQL